MTLEGKKISDKLYSKYNSTHESVRVGKAAPERSTMRIYSARFGRYLPANRDAEIIDLGCGSGRLLAWLENLGYRNLTGVDISDEQIKIAASNTSATLIKDRISSDVFTESKYDVICMIDILEHLDKSEILCILESARSALKDNGLLVIQVPNNSSPFGSRMQHGDFTHKTAFNSSSLTQALSIAGFDDIKIEPWVIPVISMRALFRRSFVSAVSKLTSLCYYIESGTAEIATPNIIAFAKR
jgi:2-polyprenyl-3-methyl-5-hydroxy-6-metoxy-1,4-benzoquinol methylase